jgi:hypothetical protein
LRSNFKLYSPLNVFTITILEIAPGKILQKGCDCHFWFYFQKQL